MSKPHVFYSMSETASEIQRILAFAIGLDETAEEVESFLQRMEGQVFDGEEDPERWRKVKIFRITVEEVPRPANTNPKAEPNPAGGKQE